jgi:epoxyqueuosine reductase
MGERPEYSGVFEFINEHLADEYRMLPATERYRELIESEQYDRPLAPVSPGRRELPNPAEAAEWVKGRARELHADLVGITRLNRDWTFAHGHVEGTYAIVLGVRMDYRDIKAAPDLRQGAETTRAYYALGHIVHALTDALRSEGWEAWPQHPRFSHKRHHSMVHPPHAIAAGLGRLGRHGLVITEEFGPCVRWGAVTTHMPLDVDPPNPVDVLEYCEGCTDCRDACEADAIPDEPTVVRGVRKYKVLPMRCAHEFARWDGCSKCQAYCPFLDSYPEGLRDVRPWTPSPADGGPLPTW